MTILDRGGQFVGNQVSKSVSYVDQKGMQATGMMSNAGNMVQNQASSGFGKVKQKVGQSASFVQSAGQSAGQMAGSAASRVVSGAGQSAGRVVSGAGQAAGRVSGGVGQIVNHGGQVMNTSGVSSINQSRQLVVAGTQENTVILQHILDGSFVSREDLQKHLEEAKRRLTELKRDEIVLAKTRTVKRLLDHVKIEGSQNLSNKARDKIALSQQDGFVIGLEVTKLRDEISEKERELSGMFQASTFRYDQMTSLLARRERDLYETSVLHNTLEMKAKKDDTESQAHVLEYANRNNELTQKIRKIEAAIYQEQTIYNKTVTQLRDLHAELEIKRRPVPPPPKTEIKNVRDQQDIDAEEDWIPKLKQRIKDKEAELQLKKRQLEAADDADINGLKQTLAEAMKNIQKLRLSNDELENENRDITDKIAKIRAKIGGGVNLDGEIQATSKMKGIDELNRLKAKNEELLKRLQQLKEPEYTPKQPVKSDQDERIKRILQNAEQTDADVEQFLNKPNNRPMRKMGASITPAPFSGPSKPKSSNAKRVNVNTPRKPTQSRTQTRTETRTQRTDVKIAGGGPAVADLNDLMGLGQAQAQGNVSAGRRMSSSGDEQSGNAYNRNSNQSNNRGFNQNSNQNLSSLDQNTGYGGRSSSGGPSGSRTGGARTSGGSGYGGTSSGGATTGGGYGNSGMSGSQSGGRSGSQSGLNQSGGNYGNSGQSGAYANAGQSGGGYGNSGQSGAYSNAGQSGGGYGNSGQSGGELFSGGATSGGGYGNSDGGAISGGYSGTSGTSGQRGSRTSGTGGRTGGSSGTGRQFRN